MISLLFQPEIIELIELRDFVTLRDVLTEWEPADIAELIETLEEAQQAILFRILPKDIATDTFEHLELDVQYSLIHALGQEQVAEILNDMSPDDRTEMLEELPAAVVRRLLSIMSPEERKVAQVLLGYPENSIGRLMTTDFIAIQDDKTVQETLDYIRENGQDSETLYTIYVVDSKGLLIDALKIRYFLLSHPETKVKDIMDSQYVSLKVYDDQETAVAIFKKYDSFALPVTDSSGMLVGMVTADDVLDVAEEEATEDMLRIAGVQNIEDSYVDVSLTSLIKKRAVWLTILFLGEILTTSAMGIFEEQIAVAVILVIFIPLIISSGGNTGSQAATLIIRALALGELNLKDWWFIMKREFSSGLILGSILGIIGFLKIMAWQFAVGAYGEYWFYIGLTIGTALVGVVLWGTLMGSMLPLILKKMKFDPAVSSAPFVATLVDVTGIIIYFTVATFILSGKLL